MVTTLGVPGVLKKALGKKTPVALLCGRPVVWAAQRTNAICVACGRPVSALGGISDVSLLTKERAHEKLPVD